MALPRKKPAKIFKRDHAFTQTIGKPTAGKPNPFALAAEGLKETLEASLSAETSSPPPREPAPEPRQLDEVPALPELPAATVSASEVADPQPAEVAPVPEPPATHRAEAEKVEDEVATKTATEGHTGDAAPPTARALPEAGRAGDTAAPVELAITMWIPSDLVERAEKWGAAMRLPAGTILRQTFAKLKPELVIELRSITTGDVHLDRAERVGHRLQSRLRFSPAEFADMKARLDPADFGILPSMLNHYARNRFSSFLDELMAGAGY